MKQNNNQASPAKTKHIAVYGVDSYGDENAVYGSEADQAQENKAVSSDNRISVVVDPAVKAQFIQKIRDAWALLPFLIKLRCGINRPLSLDRTVSSDKKYTPDA